MKEESSYTTLTLSDGLRILCRRAPSPVVYCGFAIDAGTRDEAPGFDGMAHFCEHMSFKGTKKRNALEIINYLESVGGELNAYTTKEDTVYYAAVMHSELPRAVSLLCDIVFHSVYPQKEINKEVEVICDEIESYNDSPSDLIYDEIENLLFRNHPLGHNILGASERVRTFKTADALAFTHRFYKPENSVFFISGDVEASEIARLLCQETGATLVDGDEKVIERRKLSKPDADAKGTIVRHRDTHQTHVMTGCRSFSANDKRRWPLYLLNNVLGGPGLNSRLNLSLRERKGLVYTVESMMTCYGDTGLWAVYFGCDRKDRNQCMDLVLSELKRLSNEGLRGDELDNAKRQLKGQLGIASDNRENFILDAAKNFLHYGSERDMKAIMANIDAITEEDAISVAREIFRPEQLTTLVYE